jgi:diguanylate cyclase (GGDEF)-like protein
MSIDFKTLFLLTLDVEAMLGVLLLFSWMQNTAVRAVAWWGCAHLLRSLSIGLYGMYGALPDLITITVADVILFGSYAVTWTGARIFDGRAPRPGSLITGAAVWLSACQFSEFAQAPAIRASLSAAIIAAFMWLTAYEFWRSRAERLLSRRPAIFILFANGAMFLLRSPPIARLAWPVDEHVLSRAWLTVISSESLLATISTAFILLAMAKERAELRHKTAASKDPLTGLANRRSFFQEAARLMQTSNRPVALLMIDLDHFKSINDQFGHAAGDEVLRIFAKTTSANLRPSDLVGRLGGEEFAVLLPAASQDGAWFVAAALRICDRGQYCEWTVHSGDGERRDVDPRPRTGHGCTAGSRRSGALPGKSQRAQPGCRSSAAILPGRLSASRRPPALWALAAGLRRLPQSRTG